VDVVVEVASREEYYQLEKRLRATGKRALRSA
jgi:hypothetical protein